jgi:hypothetical protein
MLEHYYCESFLVFTGGNQRELARAKNQKKLQDQQKSKGGAGAAGDNKSMNLEQRKQR